MYSILGSGKVGLLQEAVIAEVAAKLDVVPAAVCIAWSIRLGCAVLAKSTNPERIDANFHA